MRHYMITMGIRVACFLLMVLITPYSWYTWIFAAGAVFLPYIAVVYANASQGGARGPVESPTLELAAPGTVDTEPSAAVQTITVEERAPQAPEIAARADESDDDDKTAS